MLSFLELSWLLTSIITVSAATYLCAKVPFPEKISWLVGVGSCACYAVINLCYGFGGRYLLLFPALFWIQATMETVGALAICVAIYSSVNKADISPHWYSLPTGCTPLTILSQYVPSWQLSMVIFSALLCYLALILVSKRPSEGVGKIYLCGVGLLLGAVAVREVKRGLLSSSVNRWVEYNAFLCVAVCILVWPTYKGHPYQTTGANFFKKLF
eukprot:gb/GEZN01009060.1/.p1 GENE.gb/GEZN01009060.1/~~gb/GEZN01009060.1/.p1  ORF type:complete len:213 (+),score=23.96 gb/GEZN01009060.1/:79-717(+)